MGTTLPFIPQVLSTINPFMRQSPKKNFLRKPPHAYYISSSMYQWCVFLSCHCPSTDYFPPLPPVKFWCPCNNTMSPRGYTERTFYIIQNARPHAYICTNIYTVGIHLNTVCKQSCICCLPLLPQAQSVMPPWAQQRQFGLKLPHFVFVASGFLYESQP